MSLFSIVDIETTGGSSKSDKITEIAIYVSDGEKIVDTYESLINPERVIPYQITALTGITNQMVEDAPKFFELARKIVEITENTVFVAHNASFDYGFVKREFERLGYRYKRDTLCTVKLSRKLIPGHKSYSLGKICQDIGININDRHRAAGDALATVKLFHMLHAHDFKFNSGKNIVGFSGKGLHPAFDITSLKALPEEAGVYYFYDSSDRLIYIGKSKNIYKRVLSHLNNERTTKAIAMKSELAYIDFELTGNELIALLRESEEIKEHKPKFNKAQRRTVHNWGLFYFYDDKGYMRFVLDKTSENQNIPLTSYTNKIVGKDHLAAICMEYNLCQNLCGLYQNAGACFYYGIGECKGACTGVETAESYNIRAMEVVRKYGYQHNNSLILLAGKHNEEIGVVAIRDGKYLGYGYADKNFVNSVEHLLDCVKRYKDNKDVQQIIRTYMDKKRDYKLLKFV
jgi:DNA polymerase-3 subunit epsilon